MSWKDAAKKVSQGKYLKWEAGDKHVVQFLDAPVPREFKAKDGSVKTSLEFAVITEGEDKVMSVSSKRLLTLIMSENDDAQDAADYEDTDEWYLRDHSFQIKALGNGIDRTWTMKEMPTVATTPKKIIHKSPTAQEVDEADETQADPAEREGGEEEKQSKRSKGKKERKSEGSDKEPLEVRIKREIAMMCEPVPFIIADRAKSPSVETVRDTLMELGYVETEKLDPVSKMKVWVKSKNGEKEEA